MMLARVPGSPSSVVADSARWSLASAAIGDETSFDSALASFLLPVYG